MTGCKLLVVLMAAALIGSFFALDLGRFLTLDSLRGGWVEIDSYYRAKPVRALALYFVGYVTLASLSLPGAAIMMLAAGAVFGVFVGVIVASFASSIGVTIAFLLSRFLLRDVVQRRFGCNLAGLNREMERDGAFYIFALRMMPALPHSLTSAVVGVTLIRTPTFYVVSQLGMLPATFVYVQAGSRLAGLESGSGIVSPGLVVLLSLLGLMLLLARKLMRALRAGG